VITSPHLGALMGYADREAPALGLKMDRTYRARLAKATRQELQKGIHPDDIRQAMRLLFMNRPLPLSPALLGKKVQDLQRFLPSKVSTEPDPFADTPQYRADTSYLLREP